MSHLVMEGRGIFILSEGARFIGLCDKIGQGIDLVYRGVLAGGLPFPEFESENGEFAARVPLEGSAEFREFLRKRSQALTQLEEIIVLRVLWSKDAAGLSELASRMQRKKDVAARVLEGMERKSMVERAGAPDVFSLPSIIRRDIETIFQSDQLSLDQSLWGG